MHHVALTVLPTFCQKFMQTNKQTNILRDFSRSMLCAHLRITTPLRYHHLLWTTYLSTDKFKNFFSLWFLARIHACIFIHFRSDLVSTPSVDFLQSMPLLNCCSTLETTKTQDLPLAKIAPVRRTNYLVDVPKVWIYFTFTTL